MNTGIIIPLGDGSKLRGYSSGSRLALAAAPCMPVSAFDGEVDRLIAGGYLPFLRPCLPPGVNFTTWDRATKQAVEKVSEGKVPGEFSGGKWKAMADWPNRSPTDADVALWRTWPGAGVSLATGTVAALDIDIKIGASETGPEADRGRALVAAIKTLAAEALGLTVARLPMRWRENSTSCMILVRLAAPLGKRILQFTDRTGGRPCAVEFLAKGQQIVLAGMHTSGARVQSSLPNVPLDALPVLENEKLDTLIPAIVEAAEPLGFRLASSKASAAGREQKPPYSPAVAVLREVMARRSDWVPSIVPCTPLADREWRITSADLDRDLEEDLAVFPDGIHDYGTERTHTPISFIREFGAVASDRTIRFGGSPDYSQSAGQPYVIVGEADPSVRRPNETEALTWLCRTLAGHQFPAFEPGATWASSLSLVARSVGLDWASLESARGFEFAEGAGPETWQPSQLRENADFLVALRAIDPDAFVKLEFAVEHSVVLEISDERQAAVALSSKTPATPSTAAAISWIDPSAWLGKPIKEREWEVEGWIPRHETTLLYGDGGVGKTLLIHQYATAAATGKPWLGQETRPARVMAFFCEDSEDELHRRQADINGMLHVNYPDLGNLRISSRKHEDNALGVWDRATGTTKLTPAWHRLRDDAVAWGADVLIIDTLSDVYVGEEIARAQVNSFVKTCLGRLASEIGGSVIALGHPSVSGKTSGSGTSGSTQWSNAVRSRLYLRYPDKAERGTIRELETMKLNYGPKGSVLKIKWSRGAFNVVAGMSTADRPEGFPASAVPDLADAVEAAVAAAINENAGVVLSPAPKSQHYAPKVLKRRSPDVLQAFGISEVEAAIDRMDRKGTIRHEEIGRDSSRRPIKGYVIVPDKMSETAPSSSTVFD